MLTDREKERLKQWKKTRPVAFEGTKVCSDCGEEKLVTDFYIHRGGKFGRSHHCKPCSNINVHFSNIRRLYNLSREEYNEMYERGCTICGTKEQEFKNKRRLTVDHCHETNKVRGILCDHCNFMIGNAKNNSSLLRKAADYLEG